jgi:hypothetical protein
MMIQDEAMNVALHAELTEKVNSLSTLLDRLHATEAKKKLQEAYMWAESMIKPAHFIGGTE